MSSGLNDPSGSMLVISTTGGHDELERTFEFSFFFFCYKFIVNILYLLLNIA